MESMSRMGTKLLCMQATTKLMTWKNLKAFCTVWTVAGGHLKQVKFSEGSTSTQRHVNTTPFNEAGQAWLTELAASGGTNAKAFLEEAAKAIRCLFCSLFLLTSAVVISCWRFPQFVRKLESLWRHWRLEASSSINQNDRSPKLDNHEVLFQLVALEHLM